MVVSVAVFTMSLSPALAGFVQAGGIHFEGVTSAKTLDGQHTRGLMLNFSFGGPKGYKKSGTVQDMDKADLTSGQTAAIFGAGLVGAILLVLILDDGTGADSGGSPEE